MAETWTKRVMPAAWAPSIDFRLPSRSTVRLRSMLPSGPPPAVKTTASQPANASANAGPVARSMSRRRTCAPSSSSVGPLVIAADQGDRCPAGLDQEWVEVTGHLSVAPDDGDVAHAPTVRRRRSGTLVGQGLSQPLDGAGQAE